MSKDKNKNSTTDSLSFTNKSKDEKKKKKKNKKEHFIESTNILNDGMLSTISHTHLMTSPTLCNI